MGWNSIVNLCAIEGKGCHPQGTKFCTNGYRKRSCTCKPGWINFGDKDDCSVPECTKGKGWGQSVEGCAKDCGYGYTRGPNWPEGCVGNVTECPSCEDINECEAIEAENSKASKIKDLNKCSCGR